MQDDKADHRTVRAAVRVHLSIVAKDRHDREDGPKIGAENTWVYPAIAGLRLTCNEQTKIPQVVDSWTNRHSRNPLRIGDRMIARGSTGRTNPLTEIGLRTPMRDYRKYPSIPVMAAPAVQASQGCSGVVVYPARLVDGPSACDVGFVGLAEVQA